jgi:hypothetical protein
MNETCGKDWKLLISSKIMLEFLISSVQNMPGFACLFNTDCSLNIEFEFRSAHLTVD